MTSEGREDICASDSMGVMLVFRRQLRMTVKDASHCSLLEAYQPYQSTWVPRMNEVLCRDVRHNHCRLLEVFCILNCKTKSTRKWTQVIYVDVRTISLQRVLAVGLVTNLQ